MQFPTHVTVGNISAQLLAHSISEQGIPIYGFLLDYPRFIHSEVMTHKMLVKNAASSRAIPMKAIREQIRANTARPVHWGQNQSGMQAKEELPEAAQQKARALWDAARDSALHFSERMEECGLHKQATNRTTEPYQMMRTVLSGTDIKNLIWLRHHPDAQPEFYHLVDMIIKCINNSTPQLLNPGEWHLPFVETVRLDSGVLIYRDAAGEQIDVSDALRISSSCCAQASYRKSDDSLDKANSVFSRLIESEPVHASPTEHQATPMRPLSWWGRTFIRPSTWEAGVTHIDRDKQLWSAGFRGWIQHRKLIPNESRPG